MGAAWARHGMCESAFIPVPTELEAMWMARQPESGKQLHCITLHSSLPSLIFFCLTYLLRAFRFFNVFSTL